MVCFGKGIFDAIELAEESNGGGGSGVVAMASFLKFFLVFDLNFDLDFPFANHESNLCFSSSAPPG